MYPARKIGQGVDALCAALPAYICAHHAEAEGLSYHAAPLDFSFADAPTFSVAVFESGIKIAVYKLNILHFAAEDALVFSPLVVTWEAGASRPAGTGARVVAHCISWIAAAQKQGMFAAKNIALTTGNLTKARAGLPFFTALGWDIVDEQTAQGYLYTIAQRLAAMAAPFQTEDKTEASIAFACRFFTPCQRHATV